jgi:hypothetical protein
MRMKRLAAATALIGLLLVTACAAHIHTVGSGPAGGDVQIQRQWYVLWGIVPINNVDSHAMAGSATNYRIRTEVTPVDFIISIFTGMVTVSCRSVTVTK